MTALIAAPAALLLNPGRADAILSYYIFDSGPNQVTLQASGSISRAGGQEATINNCGVPGRIESNFGVLCTGGNASYRSYRITGGLASFPGPGSASTNNVSGIVTYLFASQNRFVIAPSYVDGTPIVSSAIFSNTSLASLGFTPGPLTSYQLVNVPGDAGRIDVVIGPPPVPGPIPLFGAAAAFGWSRTLRRRISASGISSKV